MENSERGRSRASGAVYFWVSLASAAWRLFSRATLVGSHRWLGPRFLWPQVGHMLLAGMGAAKVGPPDKRILGVSPRRGSILGRRTVK